MIYLLNITNYLTLIIFIILTFKFKKTLKYIIYVISVFSFILVLSSLLINVPLFINNYNLLPILLQSIFILSFIPLYSNNKKHLIIYSTFLIPLDIVIKILLSRLLNLPFIELNQAGFYYFSTYQLTISLFIKILMLLIIKLIIDISNNKEIIYSSISYISQFLLEFIGIIIVNYSLVKIVFINQINYNTLVLVNILLILIFLGIIIINLILQKISMNKEKEIEYYKINQLENEYNKIYDTSVEEIIKLRHDVANIVNSINKYHDLETQEIFDSLSNKLSETKIYYSSNKMLNAILVNKIKQAKDKGITIELNINSSAEIRLDNSDIISLLTNLIDNSIEAAYYADDKVIKLDIISNDSFNVVIKNAYTENIKIEKENKHLHGYGTRIIKDIVNKNNGKILVQKDNGYYLAHIFLPYK